MVVVVSQFNGTSTPKGSYSAKTGDNDCNVNSRHYSLSTALCESNSLSGQVWTKCPTRPGTQGAPQGGCSHGPRKFVGALMPISLYQCIGTLTPPFIQWPCWPFQKSWCNALHRFCICYPLSKSIDIYKPYRFFLSIRPGLLFEKWPSRGHKSGAE